MNNYLRTVAAVVLCAAVALVPQPAPSAAAASASADVVSSPPLSYVHEPPSRLVDTRLGNPNIGVPKGRIPAYGSLTIKTQRGATPPQRRQALVVSLTVVRPSGFGYLTAGPAKATGTTALTFIPGVIQTQAITTLTAGPDESFVVFNHSDGSIDLIVDETGYFTSSRQAGGLFLFGLPHERIADTRIGLGVRQGQVPPHGVLFVYTGGRDAAALWITVTRPTASGWLSAASGISTSTSVVSFTRGQTVTATATVSTADTGTVTLYNGSSGYLDVVVDRDNLVGTTYGSRFVAQSPSRLVDTRIGLGAGGSSRPIAPHSWLEARVTGGTSPVPIGSRGVAVSVTVVHPQGVGYLNFDGSSHTSALSFEAGNVRTGFALVEVPPAGTIRIYNESFGTVHLIVDVEGYLLPPHN